MKISIIIPAYNEAKYLGACLESILKNKDQSLHEIIVVDNNSTDGTAELAKGFAGVKVVHEKEKGATRARSAGFDASTGDIIAYLDADTKMPAGWLAQIEKEFSNHPDVVALSGPYIFYDASWIYNFTARIYWVFLAMPSYFVTRYMAVGGNMAARRSALLAIGGFDRNINFYGDDTDIARRLHKIGKVKFKLSFVMHDSARRLKEQGLLKTGFIYACNFLSVVLLHVPVTKEYKDIR